MWLALDLVIARSRCDAIEIEPASEEDVGVALPVAPEVADAVVDFGRVLAIGAELAGVTAGRARPSTYRAEVEARRVALVRLDAIEAAERLRAIAVAPANWAASLRWASVDHDEGTIAVVSLWSGAPKNDQARTVPLPPELAALLRRWRRATGANADGLVIVRPAAMARCGACWSATSWAGSQRGTVQAGQDRACHVPRLARDLRDARRRRWHADRSATRNPRPREHHDDRDLPAQ
ncbi:MAG TPA: hypothetical protein VHE35_03395 [Kofleriaceae bacterium]|nr:hypothetical protein [Kofleriaceae bacterium]